MAVLEAVFVGVGVFAWIVSARPGMVLAGAGAVLVALLILEAWGDWRPRHGWSDDDGGRPRTGCGHPLRGWVMCRQAAGSKSSPQQQGWNPGLDPLTG